MIPPNPNSTHQSHIQTNRTIPPPISQKIAQDLQNITFKQFNIIRQYLQNRPIKTAKFRDHILIENTQLSKPKAILILQGTIQITKKLGIHTTHMRDLIQFAQLTGIQFVGMQTIISNNVVKYTVTVRSGFVDYVQIQDASILQIIFRSMQQIIVQKQKKRDQQFIRKYKEGQKKSDEEHKKQLLQRLSLPNIKLFGNLERIGVKAKSTSKLPNMISESVSQKNIRQNKKISLNLSEKHPGFRKDSQGFSLKFDPKKSPKSIKNSKVSESVPERSEKLFKQHLKYIIKRKLGYERKQLGVLKAFRQNTDGQMIVHEARPGISHQGSDVDQYFRI